MPVKKITTCVEQELWREAVLANVSWAEAMKAGIKLYIGDSMAEGELKHKKKMLEGELKHIQKKLDDITKERQEKEDFEKLVIKNLGLLQKATPLVMEDIKRLKAWTRRWINETHVKITEKEFFQLCKCYHDGEFGGKK